MPPRDEMTPSERVDELRGYEVVEVPFHLIHTRLEELLGRPFSLAEVSIYPDYEALCQQAGIENPDPDVTDELAVKGYRQIKARANAQSRGDQSS